MSSTIGRGMATRLPRTPLAAEAGRHCRHSVAHPVSFQDEHQRTLARHA
jgi:hypothetical protein